MSDDTQMVKRGADGVTIHMRQATDVAGACREIVEATAQDIQGKRYVRVEGWQAIANAHGCMASSRDVTRVDGGFRCIGEVRRVDTGAVVSTAEGFVGDDEKTWVDRPEYAKRAMCQTRAISRACRSAFAHVVVMMKAGLETTPAEEVPAEGFENAKAVKPEETKPSRPPSSAQRHPQNSSDVISEKQGKRLYAICKNSNVSMDALKWYLKNKYDIEHSADILRSNYDAICNWAQAGGQIPPNPDDDGRGPEDNLPM